LSWSRDERGARPRPSRRGTTSWEHAVEQLELGELGVRVAAIRRETTVLRLRMREGAIAHFLTEVIETFHCC
jgi:hypothetical protein